MLYLDYAKPLADGKYILSFFADSVADLESISHGQKFVTKNGTDYGVPQAGSTVIVTSPNSGKTTYVMDAEGIWVVTEDISYSAVVANPSDAATAKLEKLKVNDTTYANWTENEIKSIASESGGGKLYLHKVTIHDSADTKLIKLLFVNSNSNKITNITQNLVNTAIECNASPTTPPTYYECGSVPIYITNGNIEASGFTSYPFDIMNTISVNIELATAAIEDDVTEL